MRVLQAIFLGVVQGLTEFLPVSSSGHLVFFQSLFGLDESQVAFDVMLHLGTLLAVVVYFRTDISQILLGTWAWVKGRREGEEKVKLLLWIVVATIPTGLMGILFKDWFESLFSRPQTVGFMLLVTGGALWLTRTVKRKEKTTGEMGAIDALIIGIAQGVAIIPGISRSGATISTGLFRGLNRELAGKFSFLLSIPAILAATLLKFREIDTSSGIGLAFIGTAVAFFVGLFSLKLLMKIIRAGKLSGFAYYCWAIGIVMILLTR
ncbi:MAG: undecaprenyl-diphosphatase UppP [Deltaproteobacteria bacterium]